MPQKSWAAKMMTAVTASKGDSNQKWRKCSDGALIGCRVAAAGVKPQVAGAAEGRRDSSPRRERLFELLLRYPSRRLSSLAQFAACVECVSWQRNPDDDDDSGNDRCCLRCGGGGPVWRNIKRRGSDPSAVLFGRILTADEHGELLRILKAQEEEEVDGHVVAKKDQHSGEANQEPQVSFNSAASAFSTH